MTRKADESAAVLRMARDDRDSVAGLTRELVRITSRAGTDPHGPAQKCMSWWLAGAYHAAAPPAET